MHWIWETSVVKEGEPLGLLYGRVATGIIKTEEQLAAAKEAFPYYTSFDPYLDLGDIAFEYEDGYWKEDVIGRSTPDFFGGYTNTFTWKQFTLTALFTFSYGNDLIYQKDVSDSGMSSLANRGTRVLNHYSETNTSSNRPRSMWAATYMLTSLNVYDASYLKLKTLTLNYNLPQASVKKSGSNLPHYMEPAIQCVHTILLSRTRSRSKRWPGKRDRGRTGCQHLPYRKIIHVWHKNRFLNK